MTTVELIWGWTQFILNVVLIVSSLKIVYDISTYVKHSDRRFKALYIKACKAGENLNNFDVMPKQRKFRRLVAKLIEADPKVENPFTNTPFEWPAEVFEEMLERSKTYRWKLWH